MDRQLWREFDWLLLGSVLVLSIIGIFMIYSATFRTEDLTDYWFRQSRFLGVGIVLMLVVAAIDYRHLEILAPPIFLFYVGTLFAVLALGDSQNTGSTRWISIGGTLVQPTEVGKFLLIIYMAWYLSRFRTNMDQFIYVLGAVVILVGPLVLVYIQPDLGMTITIGVVGGVLILVSGIRFTHLFILGGIGLASLVPLRQTLSGYMIQRISMFVNPDALENQDAVFNVDQALIAVGSGGWLGAGWTQGSQNQLAFLRVRHTDFIFSVIAEELGLLGAVLILLLLLVIVFRLFRIADMAQDEFGRLLATGVATVFLFQITVNVGMNLRMLPVTGLTLPFISYGGSSLLSMLLAVGLAQSVAMRHRKIGFM